MDEIERKANLVTKMVEVTEDRVIRFVGSNEAADRTDDIIEVDGWDVDSYLKNPVFLWAHDYSIPPVGKAKRVTIDKRAKALIFDIYFPTIEELSTLEHPSEHALFTDTVYKMYKAGILNATSVGFKGKKYDVRTDQADKPAYERGMRFSGQELLELSAVPVPANPEALAIARNMPEVNQRGFEMVMKSLQGDYLKSKEEVTIMDSVIVEKAGAKYSKETREALKSCADKIKEACDMLEKMASDGVEEPANDTSDGVEDTKAVDVAPAVVIKKSLTLDSKLSDIENLR